MFNEVAEQIERMLAPDFAIHTCGIRLAAIGDREFQRAMGKRRSVLGGYKVIGMPSIVADDDFAIIRGTYVAEHKGRKYSQETMSTWRFDRDGRAAEHWEHAPSRVWDEFWMACDPDFSFTSGREFWLKDV